MRDRVMSSIAEASISSRSLVLSVTEDDRLSLSSDIHSE